MEDWDQEQLEKVVNEKHGAEKPSNKTDIICKFFLDAVENKQYGWCGDAFSHFWAVLRKPHSTPVLWPLFCIFEYLI